MKREFLMLAHKYDPKKHFPTGHYVSEKLDGIRAFWDGGISRGLSCREVPWANVEKDGRLLVQPVATGLWSRYAKVIHAPSWWLDDLPNTPLDGELWLGRGKFQTLASIVKDHDPSDEWKNVRYMVFDSPNLAIVFADGILDNTNFKKTFMNIPAWVGFHRDDKLSQRSLISTFEDNYEYLGERLLDRKYVHRHLQNHKLANEFVVMKEQLKKLADELPADQEGYMLRRPTSYWSPDRSHNLLKIKPFHDAEALVKGFVWGRETDKGSKLLGLMGSMIVSFNGKEFELSGFTDSERVLIHPQLGKVSEGHNYPGSKVSDNIVNPLFPRGSLVTFRYRELTDAKIPKEARFLRKYE